MKTWIALLFVAFVCDMSMAPIQAEGQTYDTLLIKQQGTSVYVKTVIKTDTKLLPTTLGTGTPSALTYLTGAKTWVTMPVAKRQETYSGSTSSGVYTITYGTAYSVPPNVQFQLGTGANNKETILLSSSTTTGCSFLVQLRADVLGLLPSYSNVNGRNVDVLVTEK